MTKEKDRNPFELTFKNLDRDIERYLDRFGLPDHIGSIPCIRGYDEAQRVVFNAYLERKKYEAVARYIVTCWNWDWGINEFFRKASEFFRRENQIIRLKRIWRSAIFTQKRHFWELHSVRERSNVQESILKVKRIVLEHMNLYRQILVEIGDEREIRYLDEEIFLMEKEKRRKAVSKPVSDEINEELFWKLIETAGRETDSIAEQVEAITARLEEFRAGQIKRFQKILDQKMQLAYHWDLWALAYLAQEGCSDDAFEGFRAWLILKGQKIYNQALQDCCNVLEFVPSGVKTSGEELLSAPSIAYEVRADKTLPPSNMQLMEPAGQSWNEDEIESLYPKVFSFYRNSRFR